MIEHDFKVGEIYYDELEEQNFKIENIDDIFLSVRYDKDTLYIPESNGTIKWEIEYFVSELNDNEITKINV